MDHANNLRSRQLNPCDHLYWKCRGYAERPHNWQELLEDAGYYDDSTSEEEDDYDESESEYDTEEEDDETEYDSDEVYEQHCQQSNANNPNNDEFWRLKGFAGRPSNWIELKKYYVS